MPSWPRFLPRPFELFTYGSAALIVAYLRASGLRIDLRTVEFIAVPLLSRLPTVLAIGAALQIVVVLLRRRSVRDWLLAVLQPAALLLWLRFWLVATTVTYAYCWLKVSVPLLHQRLFDTQLWGLDRALHFGLSPSVFVAELVQGTPVAGWLDGWYSLWVTTVLCAFAFVSLSPRAALRRHFALATAALWLVGVWIYLALPALGPCFAAPDAFGDLLRELPHARGGQSALWQNYLRMLAGRDGSLRQFNPYYGVAAFPSLHVGAHWLFALWARRHERRLFLPLALATALTFLGSLATGWHYAVDGYAGLLLAWGAVRLADRLEPFEESGDRARISRSQAPPAAPEHSTPVRFGP